MAEDIKQLDEKKVVAEFFEALKNDASIEDLAAIINKAPNLLNSEEFIKHTFPPRAKDEKSMGLVSVDKMMTTLQKLKSMEAYGLIDSAQLEAFLSSQNPEDGETFASFVAKQAVAAYDKANIDRAPDPNLPESDQQIFQQNHEKYTDALAKMEELGVPMNQPNAKGETIENIALLSVTRDADGNSNPLGRNGKSNALHVSVNDEENGLQVGGQEKAPLKVNLKQKEALKVKTEQKPENKDDINEATVEDAPEEDKKKGSGYEGSRIREQDIIEYMYNEWFLAALSWTINKSVGLACAGVDALCEKSLKNFNKMQKAKQNQKKQNSEDFAQKGRKILFQSPAQLHNQYEASNNQRRAMWNEISRNLGNPNAQWQQIDMNNPQANSFVEKLKQEYKANPQQLKNKIDSLLKNSDQVQQVNSTIDRLSSTAAAVDFIYEKANKGKIEQTLDLSDAEVHADLQKRTLKRKIELQENLEKGALYVELRMKKEGITDPKQIEQKKADFTAAYLTSYMERIEDCRQHLSVDLDKNAAQEESNSNKPLSDESKKSYKEFSRLSDMDKLGDALIYDTYKREQPHDLNSAAREMNTQSPIEAAAGQLEAIKAENSMSREDVQARKQRLNEWKDKVFGSKSFENFSQKTNNVVNQIYSNIKDKSGR